ncbi:MAG: pseudouridine synthase [Spirochaetaceae bacterium]
MGNDEPGRNRKARPGSAKPGDRRHKTGSSGGGNRPSRGGDPGQGSRDKPRGPRDESGPLRLQLFLARAGVASRRRCEEIIASGRVQVNGEVVQRQGVTVDPETDEVRLDGKPIRQARNYVYFALNKPPGYLTSNKDPEGRSLAIELIREAYSGRLFSVGRLDFLSSGLIFFTNDGRFADRVAHPSSRIEKEYLVETKRPIPRELLEQWRSGIEIEGERYHLKSYTFKGPRRVQLVLEEGKNREIRNVLHAHNIPTKRVHRVRIGRVTLGDLGPGAFRKLTKAEVEGLLDERRRN